MTKLLHALEAIALIAFSALCIAVGTLALSADRAVKTASAQIAPLTQKASLDLDEAHRLILEAGLTAMEARKASAEERAALPGLTARTNVSLDQLNELLASIRRTSDGLGTSQQQIASSTVAAIGTVNQTVALVQPVIAQSGKTIAALQVTTADLDKQINAPANAQIEKNLSDGTAALAATAKDGQQFVHGLLHPTWPHKVYNVMLDVAHVFNPL